LESASESQADIDRPQFKSLDLNMLAWQKTGDTGVQDERAGSAPYLICPTGVQVERVSSPIFKNISLPPSGKSLLQPTPFRPTEGRHAIVTAAGRDAVDADSAADERRVRRTAKSCGPDAPTLASSWRKQFRR